ncbi:hypothetical protein BKA56DRAFT_348069 [Ilyonectria sp. MPI-CAGE-AT-0026]|nr:hypothetical protein BKA56DRAFT_348069 [Ilyonectria sp. MPI-CAGE-AT-0026]
MTPITPLEPSNATKAGLFYPSASLVVPLNGKPRKKPPCDGPSGVPGGAARAGWPVAMALSRTDRLMGRRNTRSGNSPTTLLLPDTVKAVAVRQQHAGELLSRHEHFARAW